MRTFDRKLFILKVGAIFVLFASTVSAQGDYGRPPISYLETEVHDRVATLAKQIEAGETELRFDEKFGYLKSVLKALDVPTSSQALVFSKTSLQLQRISPRMPRALYFNDDVYVGYCQRGDVLELAATDAKQGATFYTLKQSKTDAPRFVRDQGGCLSCHESSRTQKVPGYLVRSVFSDGAGRPRFGSGTFLTDHTSDFKNRWGGWYVTGKHGSMRHMGNSFSLREEEHEYDRESGANTLDLSGRFNVDNYLTPHSDIVALMVLEHQTQMHNAIAAANYETRMALHQSSEMNRLLERPKDHVSDSAKRRIAASADRVLKHLLMHDEFQLTDRVSGTTLFADEFTARGKEDSQGRSLREFDLETRLFKYPCSFLIHSPAFDGLPDAVRTQVMTRLLAILEGRDESEDYAHLSPTMRQDILEILRDTKSELKELR